MLESFIRDCRMCMYTVYKLFRTFLPPPVSLFRNIGKWCLLFLRRHQKKEEEIPFDDFSRGYYAL